MEESVDPALEFRDEFYRWLGQFRRYDRVDLQPGGQDTELRGVDEVIWKIGEQNRSRGERWPGLPETLIPEGTWEWA